jgi:hypothetical protein
MAIVETFSPGLSGTDELQAIRSLEMYEGKIDRIIEHATKLTVVSNWSAEEAISFGGEAKQLAKSIDAARKAITDPARKFVNKMNDVAKVFTEKLEQVETIIKMKVSSWKRAQAEKVAIEEENAKALSESLGIEVAAYVAEAPKNIRGDGAMSYEQTVWRYEIEDESLIPREYLCIDDTKVKGVVKAGIRNIPGLKIFSEQKTIIKSR